MVAVERAVPDASDAAVRAVLEEADHAARLEATAAGETKTGDAFARVLASTPNADRAQLELIGGRLRARIMEACYELVSVPLDEDTVIVPCP